MNWIRGISFRFVVLFILWTLPVACYLAVGSLAIYQTGWFYKIVWLLPGMWGAAWLIGKVWKPPKVHRSFSGKPLSAPDFWTPQDSSAIRIVEDYRREVQDIDAQSIMDFNRYIRDAQILAERLAKHYHNRTSDELFHPLTLVEILAVIHLAAEDLEQWVLASIPGSDLATIGQIKRLPKVVNALDVVQKVVYVGSAVLNPAKMLAYPLWRKSANVTVELQNELIRGFYQRFLRQLGYYLIEMYSGRLRSGSRLYRSEFSEMADIAHEFDRGETSIDDLDDLSTTIAVMGQVNAGKSSLLNALLHNQVATTNVLPETRSVTRHQYSVPGSASEVTLLDTPGYDEADVSRFQLAEIQKAAKTADIIMLVMAANSSARDADRQMLDEVAAVYDQARRLKPPAVIVVLTHIDLLRPVREWDPPYNWRQPHTLKEESMAAAVQYARELFGDKISGYACVYTGTEHPIDSGTLDDVVSEMVAHLDHGHGAAILKAFYRKLSEDRFKTLKNQVFQLLKSVR
ncbi:GTPase family protein [Novipirellula rosea]|uniref:G domain-containing protein n=1 Tax=Novipirellula rosea TaxID=1031540 RepID=A0ABP8MXU4_9BACT